MRLIDADAIEKTLVDFATKTFRKFCISEDAIAESLVIVGVTMDLKEIISKAPTVEMRPKGKWIDGSIKPLKVCSVCGETAVVDMGGYFVESFFCPNCGADMRGDEYEID